MSYILKSCKLFCSECGSYHVEPKVGYCRSNSDLGQLIFDMNICKEAPRVAHLSIGLSHEFRRVNDLVERLSNGLILGNVVGVGAALLSTMLNPISAVVAGCKGIYGIHKYRSRYEDDLKGADGALHYCAFTSQARYDRTIISWQNDGSVSLCIARSQDYLMLKGQTQKPSATPSAMSVVDLLLEKQRVGNFRGKDGEPAPE